MACEEQCSWVEWEADRPVLSHWGVVKPTSCLEQLGENMPEKLLDQLSSQVMNENSSVTQLGCPGCDCEEVGKRALVLETSKLRGTDTTWTCPDGTVCTIIATFKLRLRKWRTPGECAPKDKVGL